MKIKDVQEGNKCSPVVPALTCGSSPDWKIFTHIVRELHVSSAYIHTFECSVQPERCQEVGLVLFCVMAVTGSTSCHIQAAGSSARTDSHLNLQRAEKYCIWAVCV